jgi:hypothetical protein
MVMTTANNESIVLGLKAGLTGAQSFEIKTTEDYAFACKQLVQVKTNVKHFKEQKETATKPLNQGIAAVRAMFKPIEDILASMETVLKTKTQNWERTQKANETAQLAKASALFQSGNAAQGMVVLNSVPEVAVVKQQGVSSRTVIKFRILNAALVPREYCEPVEALIRATVGVTGLATKIPGVEVYEDIQTTVRT